MSHVLTNHSIIVRHRMVSEWVFGFCFVLFFHSFSPSHCPWSARLKSDGMCPTMETIHHEKYMCPVCGSAHLHKPAVPWVSEQCWVSHREEISGLCHGVSPGLRNCACAWNFKFFSWILIFLSAFAFSLFLKPYHPLHLPEASRGLNFQKNSFLLSWSNTDPL